MNRFLKISLLLITLIVTFTLAGCSGSTPDNYTVRFVDRDGTVLKTVDCTAGVACDITAPEVPNKDPYVDENDTVYFVRWSVFPDDYSKINSDTTIKAIYTYNNHIQVTDTVKIAYYALFILTGMMIGLFLGLKEVKRIGIKQDDLIDGFLWIVPVSILGARLWFGLSPNTSFFVDGVNWSSIQMIFGFENGKFVGLAGLAIHGAFFTALICVILYARRRKLNLLKIFDIMAVGFIIAQAFGRWGNFMNHEAHGGLVGGYTEVGGTYVANWSLEQQFNYLRYTLHIPTFIVNNMYLIANNSIVSSVPEQPLTGYYHPTFFYESTINLIGFAIMLILRRVKKIHFGEILSFYLIWYGGLRIFIETMRTDPLEFTLFGITFKTAIVTSVFMIIGGILLSVYVRIYRKGQDYSTVPGYFGYKKEKQPEPAE